MEALNEAVNGGRPAISLSNAFEPREFLGSRSKELTVEQPMSQITRVLSIFFAPTRTFADVLRSKTWWFPLLLTILCSYAFSAAAVEKVGLNHLVSTMLRADGQTQQRLADATPEQRAQAAELSTTVLKWSMIGAPAAVAIFNLAIGLALWVSFNQVFGAKLSFNAVFCVLMYADLIQNLKPILSTIVLYLLDGSTANFNIQNPIGSNGAFFLPSDANPALRSLLSSIDAITIWYLVVMAIGFAVVGRLKRGQAFAVVFGWWAVVMFVRVGWAAVSS